MPKFKNPLLRLALVLLALLNVLPQLSTAFAQGTAFTYDGLLQKGSFLQNGTFNFTFTLFNVASSGTAIAGPITLTGVTVKSGAFTVTLDFGGAVWNGQSVWLEIGVEGPGETSFTQLMPRQEIMPTPYAIYAESANNLSGTLSFSQLTGTINNSQLANNFITVTTGTGLSGGTAVPLDDGALNLMNTGVTSLTGGDGVTVSARTGDLTLGLSSTLTLPSLPITINTDQGYFLYADNNGNLSLGASIGTPTPSGSGNTATGSTTLGHNTSGNYNTGNGAGALFNNVSAPGNTAVGYQALNANKGGSYNVGEGLNVLFENVSGSYNTALGSSALSQLGVQTPQPNEGGTNNIAIGYLAGNAFTGNESSNIDIGNIGVLGDNNVTRIGTPGIQTAAYIAGVITGNGSGLTGLNASQLTSGTINNSQLANSSIIVNTAAGLSAAGSPVPLGGTITLTNTGVTSLTGGDGVTVSAATGNLTLGLGSTLTLASLPVAIKAGGGSGISLIYADNNQNFFTGLGAGNPATGGSANTATGDNALQNNTSGNGNTAYGFNALENNNNGSQNTAEGAGALFYNSNGNGNTANGSGALLFNLAGNDNTANGSGALQANQTGSYNVAEGASALAANLSGFNNTALGYNALAQLGGTGFGGTNNIALGFAAGSAFTANESSNIDIGNIGVAGESGITRIGTPGIQTTAYIAGVITGDGSGLVNLNASQITSGTIPNTQLAHSSITINTGAGLGGGNVAVPLGGMITLYNSGVTSLTGSDGITVSAATGDLTLGLGSTLTLPNLPVAITAGGGSLLYADNNQNFFSGPGAGSPATTGSGNTAGGNGALAGDTTGSENTAYGTSALGGNGTDNTAVGYYAMRQNNGNGNTACGANALLGNLGSGNTGEGQGALQNNSGDGNTANGVGTLIMNQGSDNTAEGVGALAQNMGGSSNVANGASALLINSEGSFNTANGAGALQGNLFGSYNVADGASALAANGNGNYNTAVGYSALAHLGVGRGGSNNIALGYLAGNAFTLNESSNIDIGNIGVAGDNNIIRIGTPGIHTTAYIAGIITGNGGGLTDVNASQITYANLNNNFFAGFDVGTKTTGSGTGNTGTGTTALEDNTSGSGNSAFGYAALLSNTSGNDNTADGAGTLTANTIGYDNVAVGWDALASNTNGYQNTAVGYQSLYENTSGFNNSAVGDDALYANTTGIANTASGVLAMYNNTTGTANTADGQQALYSEQSGADNTAVGFQSLYSNASSGNTAVGRSALYFSSGSYNIAVGDYAGQDLMTGNNNIDIGNYGSTGDDSLIRIGTPGTQNAAYIAGICHTEGYACQAGTGGTSYGNTFNTWWDGSYLHLWVDTTDVIDLQGTSDRRLKESIQPMTDDALSRVMALKPSTFRYKNIPGTIFHGDGQTKEGFIADELQQVIPSAVNGEKDAVTSKGTIQPQSLNLMPIVAVLTKAVQDQQKEMLDQQKEIDELKALVKTLSERK